MKKRYRLNKRKFKAFVTSVAINVGMVMLGGAMGLGLLYAILMSPEW